MFDPITQVRQEVSDYIDTYIDIVPGTRFNTYDTIKRINLYLNDSFEDDSLFEDREKIFINISRPRAETVATYLDIDQKDIVLEERSPSGYFASSFLDYEFKTKMYEMGLSAKLNKLSRKLAQYGTVVIEETHDDFDIIDLRNIFLDPAVESIKESRFVITKYYLDDRSLREKVKEGWDSDAIEAIIAKKASAKGESQQAYEDVKSSDGVKSSKLIEVYRRFGYVPEAFIYKGGDPTKMVFAVYVVAEPFLKSKGADGEYKDEGLVLHKMEWKDELPLRDCHMFKIDGRWLGLGVMESLFPQQERVNELINQKRISMEIEMMHIFQSADPMVLSNILADLRSGDVLHSRQGISKIDNRDININSYQTELNNYQGFADRVSFANDILTGGEVPKTTPATNVVLQNNNAVKIHLFKREDFAMFVRDVMKDIILPKVISDLDEEHILKFVGDSEVVNRLDNTIADGQANAVAIDAVLSGVPITKVDKDEIKALTLEQLKLRGSKRFVKLAKGYYSKHEYDLVVHVDNEAKDANVIASNMFGFLQILASNPGAIDDPVTRELVFGYGKQIGIDVGKLEMAQAERESKQRQQPSQLPDITPPNNERSNQAVLQ